MDKKNVKDLMVPIDEYATVSENATLKDALKALQNAQQKYDKDKYRHRAIIVLNDKKQVVGKISQLDVLKAIEPKYEQLEGPSTGLSRFGFGKKFFTDMYEHHNLFSLPITDLVKNASTLEVKSFMYVPEEGEYTDVNTPIEEAIHMLVIGHHHSLLVRENDVIVGVLRLVDVFHEIHSIMNGIQ